MDNDSEKQTLVRKAKAIVAIAFRKGPIEDLHAGRSCPICNGKRGYSRITDAEETDPSRMRSTAFTPCSASRSTILTATLAKSPSAKAIRKAGTNPNDLIGENTTHAAPAIRNSISPLCPLRNCGHWHQHSA
jgi:hypothetical protein